MKVLCVAVVCLSTFWVQPLTAVSCDNCCSSQSCSAGCSQGKRLSLFDRSRKLLGLPAKGGCSSCDQGGDVSCGCEVQCDEPCSVAPTCGCEQCDTACAAPSCGCESACSTGSCTGQPSYAVGYSCEPLLKRMFKLKRKSVWQSKSSCDCSSSTACDCDSAGCVAPPSCGCESTASCGCSSTTKRGLLTRLFEKDKSCCDAGPSCGCEVCDTAGCEPSCGVETACKGGSGLFDRLFKKSGRGEATCGCETNAACDCTEEPSCGCESINDCDCAVEPSCGCAAPEPSCGVEQPCKGGTGLFDRLFKKNKKQARGCGCEISTTCDCSCDREPSCGCAEPSCGCAAPAVVQSDVGRQMISTTPLPAPFANTKAAPLKNPATLNANIPVNVPGDSSASGLESEPAPVPPSMSPKTSPSPQRIPDSQVDPFQDDAASKLRRVPATTIQYKLNRYPGGSVPAKVETYDKAFDAQASNDSVRFRFSDEAEPKLAPVQWRPRTQGLEVVPASSEQLREVPRNRYREQGQPVYDATRYSTNLR